MVLPLPVFYIVRGFLHSLGCTMDMYNNITISGFAPFILVCAKWLQKKICTCTSLPVHTDCLHHKHYRTRVLPTGTVLVTLDRYFSKLGTYSSHSCFRNIPLFKTALKKVSRKDEDAQENTGSFAILIFPNLNRVIILPQQPRY